MLVAVVLIFSESTEFSSNQLNIMSPNKTKSFVKQREAKLVLVDMEASDAYVNGVPNPVLRDTWQIWKL